MKNNMRAWGHALQKGGAPAWKRPFSLFAL